MTIDDWRARYDGLSAEVGRLRAEVERLREDAARARWCEENDADVVVYRGNNYYPIWTVVWIDGDGNERMRQDSNRNAAIDAARGVK